MKNQESFMQRMEVITLEERKKQLYCKHDFTHVINKCWMGAEVVIYCKKCGRSVVR